MFYPFRKRLNGWTEPPFKMYPGGTVPPFKVTLEGQSLYYNATRRDRLKNQNVENIKHDIVIYQQVYFCLKFYVSKLHSHEGLIYRGRYTQKIAKVWEEIMKKNSLKCKNILQNFQSLVGPYWLRH